MDKRVAAVKMRNITKTFGSVVANDNVRLNIYKGEILALLGENGSGKTTLMNMLSGIYFPDEGNIFINGEKVVIRSPKDAFEHGIGMIHQHFKLVDVFTAAENIVLGLEGHGKFDLKAVGEKVRAICERYGFDITPEQKVYDMTVSQKQTLEIVKVLYRGADILILDEPTAVLTPQETEKLFGVMREMKKDGKAIVIITHKLHEVLSVSDRVSILRKGEYIGTVDTKDATEISLTEMMVGKKVTLDIDRKVPVNPQKRLSVRNLSITGADGIKVLDNITFDAMGGEILGIAGISGCGQKELLEAIAGLKIVDEGSSIEFIEPAVGGKMMAVITVPVMRPQVGTIRPGTFKYEPVGEKENIEVIHETVDFPLEQIRTKLIEFIPEEDDGAFNLATEEVVVCLGNGLSGSDKLPKYQELADLLGGQLGCTRPIFDRGILPFKQMVGQSGVVVKPKLLISFGSSGAINHTAGMKDAGLIIAVNSDPEAAIFGVADYGIVGDMDTVCDMMIEALKAR